MGKPSRRHSQKRSCMHTGKEHREYLGKLSPGGPGEKKRLDNDLEGSDLMESYKKKLVEGVMRKLSTGKEKGPFEEAAVRRASFTTEAS